MTSGGLLRDPSRILNDPSFQRAFIIQVAVISIILAVSAFYHFYIRQPAPSSEGSYDEDIAEVDSLIVYPLKSGRGIILQEAQVSRKGFRYDRRWAIIRIEGLKKLNLKDEPRITHVVPTIDEEKNILRLRVGDACDKQLPDIGIPLEADEETRSDWPLVDNIDMYGDTADGRQPPLAPGQPWQWDKTPSEWASEIIGYPVYLLQFEPVSSKRATFPLAKPPHDMKQWAAEAAKELSAPTKLEFQDLYPFLVTSRESLAEVDIQLEAAMQNGSFKMDKEFWQEKQKKQQGYLSMQRFRPNIVLKTRSGEKPFPPYSEDSWETIWIGEDPESALAVHLVARCDRCLLTAVEPETAQRDPNVPLAILRKTRKRMQSHLDLYKPAPKPCFGMYGVPVPTRGKFESIRIGDKVRVRWRPYALDDEVQHGTRKQKAQT